MAHTVLDDDEDGDDRKGETVMPGGRVDSLFFRSRNVLITGKIDDKAARTAVTHLLALNEESDAPINVFISSPGGHVESGDMVHDVIKFIRPRVRCIGSGWVASAGALIFIAAAREDRVCLPNTRFLLHQPSGGIGGQVSDMQIQAEQIRQMRARFDRLFAEATGQTPDRIAEDTARDFWLTTQEALDYGLLGRVVTSIDELS
ncbi:ATP-dependent Clp protease proteolytic subunit [Roseivivax isoporae]|uniref:ATP-dependent Clp protease proteolytic subunit n=1 Tax=Roseivivax isoporae LMG 25204 TaxID=1449351 RepID=X7F2J3_9RHOB|nr:ATP-dependent Clp protease proteolytic subunit [Roseivivax isoporae]ETX26953.1 Clp protease proteolytic subunit ClpP [Roseivivax isoporae LMG 25204]